MSESLLPGAHLPFNDHPELPPDPPHDLEDIDTRPAVAGIAGILVLSVVATAFLLWLLYVHHAPDAFRGRLRFLPELNAILNGLSALALTVGFVFIRRRAIRRHRASMLTAFAFSSVFLLSYITNHALHGDTLYPVHNSTRTVYLALLGSHVVLSIVALPIVLNTYFM